MKAPGTPCPVQSAAAKMWCNTPCTFTTYTTECAQPTTAGTVPVPPCGNFYDGVTGDVWIKFTSTFNGSLLVKTQPSAANPTSDAAMAIYTGASCGALTLFACDDNSAGSSMPLLSIPVANGTTYYIRMWTVNPGNTGNFDLCLSSACSPPNDLPCQAIYIPLGGTAAGFNTCSGATNEPPNSAQCTAGRPSGRRSYTPFDINWYSDSGIHFCFRLCKFHNDLCKQRLQWRWTWLRITK